MAFCTECGADIPAEIKFCTSCGNPMSAAAQPLPAMAAAAAAPASAVQPTPQAAPRPAYAPPAQPQPVQTVINADAPPARGSKYAVMGTGAYIGTMLLFCIPIVGWLACVIMAFASKKLNRRNFARAMLVFLIIGAVLSAALYVVFGWVSEAVMQSLNETTNGMLGDSGGLGDLFDIINSAG